MSLDRIMGLSARHDLAALAEEVLETTETLHESGLLALLRENAVLLVDSIHLLAPMLGTLAGNLGRCSGPSG